jgi:hypothetical protein
MSQLTNPVVVVPYAWPAMYSAWKQLEVLTFVCLLIAGWWLRVDMASYVLSLLHPYSRPALDLSCSSGPYPC